jgi:hypothetical protein
MLSRVSDAGIRAAALAEAALRQKQLGVHGDVLLFEARRAHAALGHLVAALERK